VGLHGRCTVAGKHNSRRQPRGDLLLDAVPGLRHVAVLADPNVDKPPHIQALMESAKARGMSFRYFSPGRRNRSSLL
jgi:hypothetical protein